MHFGEEVSANRREEVSANHREGRGRACDLIEAHLLPWILQTVSWESLRSSSEYLGLVVFLNRITLSRTKPNRSKHSSIHISDILCHCFGLLVCMDYGKYAVQFRRVEANLIS